MDCVREITSLLSLFCVSIEKLLVVKRVRVVAFYSTFITGNFNHRFIPFQLIGQAARSVDSSRPTTTISLQVLTASSRLSVNLAGDRWSARRSRTAFPQPTSPDAPPFKVLVMWFGRNTADFSAPVSCAGWLVCFVQTVCWPATPLLSVESQPKKIPPFLAARYLLTHYQH